MHTLHLPLQVGRSYLAKVIRQRHLVIRPKNRAAAVEKGISKTARAQHHASRLAKVIRQRHLVIRPKNRAAAVEKGISKTARAQHHASRDSTSSSLPQSERALPEELIRREPMGSQVIFLYGRIDTGEPLPEELIRWRSQAIFLYGRIDT